MVEKAEDVYVADLNLDKDKAIRKTFLKYIGGSISMTNSA